MFSLSNIPSKYTGDEELRPLIKAGQTTKGDYILRLTPSLSNYSDKRTCYGLINQTILIAKCGELQTHTPVTNAPEILKKQLELLFLGN
ncbi:hypothetical protein J6590_057297 [Homalodisca vitripennis]|nr:hypothetical protein J6590_057297 [Homalodisca vitripennis]